MDNHSHLIIETPEANLLIGMRQRIGIYPQKYNRRNHQPGHLFQGRFKGISVQKEIYLLEIFRYAVLNRGN
jgi:putative transposase